MYYGLKVHCTTCEKQIDFCENMNRMTWTWNKVIMYLCFIYIWKRLSLFDYIRFKISKEWWESIWSDCTALSSLYHLSQESYWTQRSPPNVQYNRHLHCILLNLYVFAISFGCCSIKFQSHLLVCDDLFDLLQSAWVCMSKWQTRSKYIRINQWKAKCKNTIILL